MDETEGNKEENQPEIEEKHEQKQEQKQEIKEKKNEKEPRKPLFSSGWYDRHYKKFLLIAILLFIFSLGYIIFFYTQNGDIMHKDVTLTGGTTITVYGSDINMDEFESFLKNKLGSDIIVRRLEDITTRKTIAIVVETRGEANVTKTAIEEYLKYPLDDKNSSTEISGSALAKSFYNQLLMAMAIAFIFMALVVFIVFRTFIPSIAVIFACATDILGALALVDLLGFRVSTAGIAAFLMLIGYSVDTDTMLTVKTVKRRGEGTVNSRIKSAFKTGLVMTSAALVSVWIAYFISSASVLKEIFLILGCGLFMDLLTTWLGNAAILKWYCEKKKI